MRFAIVVALFVMAGQTTFGQVAVQQPVVGQTSVSTTVSVPDRGGTFLGGTSSGQMGRSQGGPLRSGTSSGVVYQSSSITTYVTIHDMQAMDEALLRSHSAARDTSPRDAADRDAAHRDVIVSQIRKSREQRVVSTDRPVRAEEKAAKFEQLARNAEKSGKPGVAKLFWESAAQSGSASAEKRLAELNRRTQIRSN